MKLQVVAEVSDETILMLTVVVVVVLKVVGRRCYWSVDHILHFHD